MLLRIDLADATIGRAASRRWPRSAGTRGCRSASGRPTMRRQQAAAGDLHDVSGPSRRWRCCGRFATAASRPRPRVMIGNRPNCRGAGRAVRRRLASASATPTAAADDERLIDALRRVRSRLHHSRPLHAGPAGRPAAGNMPAAGSSICTTGCCPAFPGMRPYHDAYASRMLTYGATCHFIVPELDAGNQIIYQSTFTGRRA